jgi:hypothetical protein
MPNLARANLQRDAAMPKLNQCFDVAIDTCAGQLFQSNRSEDEDTAWLQAEIIKGRASGLIDCDASDVLREVMDQN